MTKQILLRLALVLVLFGVVWALTGLNPLRQIGNIFTYIYQVWSLS